MEGGAGPTYIIKTWRERGLSGDMRERVLMTAAAVWPRSTSAKVARRAPLLLELRHGHLVTPWGHGQVVARDRPRRLCAAKGSQVSGPR